VSEALEQMKCIFVNAQQRAAEHSSSGMLTYIAARRVVQSNQPHVFLAKITARIPGHPARNTASGRATTPWIDFLSV
jgi:hypothetical protein